MALDDAPLLDQCPHCGHRLVARLIKGHPFGALRETAPVVLCPNCDSRGPDGWTIPLYWSGWPGGGGRPVV